MKNPTDKPMRGLARIIWDEVKIFFPIIMRAAIRMVVRPSTIKVNGIRFVLPEGLSIRAKNRIYLERYERSEVQIVNDVIKPDDIVVEAGSAIGFVGLTVARIVGPEKLFMVEANRDLIQIVRSNFLMNGYSEPNIFYGFANSGSTGKLHSFNISNEFWSSSEIDRGNTVRVDEVPEVNMTELIHRSNATIFICDIEGGEFDMFPDLEFGQIDRIIVEVHESLATREKSFRFHQSLLQSGFVINIEKSREKVCLFERVKQNS